MSINRAIGDTPMVALRRLGSPERVRIFAKLEFLNPAGSIKDRIVSYIIDEAERSGALPPGGTIVEATSGNTGAAVAMIAAARGYRAILTMPDKVSREKQETLRALGAEAIVCPSGVAPGHPEHYMEKARLINRRMPRSFMLDQYNNPMNPEAHFRTTGPEIWDALGERIDFFVASASTGGTISGVGKYLKSKKPDIKVVLLDPIGSVYHSYFYEGIVDTNVVAPYQVEGVGKDHIPDCIDFSLIDDVIQFTDDDAFATARELARLEGLLCGGSAGANVWGCLSLARRLERDATIVTVLPDSGVKYLSKIFR